MLYIINVIWRFCNVTLSGLKMRLINIFIIDTLLNINSICMKNYQWKWEDKKTKLTFYQS